MDEVVCAEEALVASVVLEPRRLAEVAQWLRPDDFGQPAAGLLYERLLQLHAAGRVSADGLLNLLREQGELRGNGYPLSHLARWLGRAPTRPHVAAYAGLVVGGEVARGVVAAGCRLVQVAERGSAVRALSAAAHQRVVLRGLHRRWAAVPATVRATSFDVAVAARTTPTASGAVRCGDEVEHAELVTIGAAVFAPHLVRRLTTWLRPTDFSSPDRAAVFEAVSVLTASGGPVDRVTVAAHLARHLPPPTGDSWASLVERAEAAVPVPLSVGCYAGRVLDAAVLRRVDRIGRELIASGCSPAHPARLLDGAVDALDDLRDAQTRLRRSRVTAAPRRAITPTAATLAAATPTPTRSPSRLLARDAG